MVTKERYNFLSSLDEEYYAPSVTTSQIYRYLLSKSVIKDLKVLP